MRGEALARKFVSRGVARADFDNDGDVDLLVNNLNDRPMLLRNDTPRRGRHWLSVALIGRPANRDAIGAVVKVSVRGRTMIQPRLSAGGYLSQHDPRLHFGVGAHRVVDRIEVVWPDGSRKTMENVPTDRHITIRR